MTSLKYTLVFFFLAIFFSLSISAQTLVNQEFYESGRIKSTVIQFGNNYRILQYHENGQMKESAEFYGTQRNGRFESWHANGSKNVVAEYSGNAPSGNWKVWNESGVKVGEADFDEGKLQAGSMWNDYGTLIAYK